LGVKRVHFDLAHGIVPNVSGNKMPISFLCDSTRTDITQAQKNWEKLVGASPNLILLSV
jgi:hypothetical protein